MSTEVYGVDLSRRTLLIVICWSYQDAGGYSGLISAIATAKQDLLIIMTKYTLILAPLEVFAKRTFLGQGPETAALPDPEQMKIK